MSNKNDFGFYGKGLDGYVHYKQSVDRINSNSNQNNSGKSRSNKNDSDEKPGIYFLGKRLNWWQVILSFIVLYGTLYLIITERI